MLKAVKAIVVGLAILGFGIVMIIQGFESDKPETGFLGLVAVFMGFFGALAGVRMIFVPASVGGSGRRSTATESQAASQADARATSESPVASIENEIFGGHRRVILPQDSLPPLPIKL